jgi:hypothetical protein
VHHTEQEHTMQKAVKPTSRIRSPRKPAAPTTKAPQVQTGPQALDEKQLRQVSGGNSLPNGGW